MFEIRAIQSITIASAALCCFAAASLGAQPDVSYAASGIFVTPPVSGEDVFRFEGQPFTLTFVLNEATKPTRRSETMAEYSNISVAATAGPWAFDGPARLALVVGAPGKPDWFFLEFPFTFQGYLITVKAKAAMPAGTIDTPAIKPFAAPVTLTPRDEMTYACTACPSPWTGHSTTLAIAGGTLSATKQESQ